ncbi:MAG: alpha/beta fold hydrolase, partial [Pseudomonadales bacterium]
RKFLYLGSGDADLSGLKPKPADADLLSDLPSPAVLPDWLSEADLDFYAAEFAASGMRGPLNYYRNHDLTWSRTAGAPTSIRQPAMFVAGERDGVILMAAEALKKLPENVPNLLINELIPGIGHWTQQEAPVQVNDAILRFLKML